MRTSRTCIIITLIGAFLILECKAFDEQASFRRENKIRHSSRLLEKIQDVSSTKLNRFTRQTRNGTEKDITITPFLPGDEPRILTVRLAKTQKDVSYGDDGQIHVLSGKEINLILYGIKLNDSLRVKLTTAKANYGDSCHSGDSHYVQTEIFAIDAASDGLTATMTIPGGKLPIINDQRQFYFCISQEKDSTEFIHQGALTNADIEVYEMLLPVWIMIVFLIILLALSGTFSGLNLGLMALDQTELKIVQNTGDENEKSYANKIFPIRKHGNFLLCTLLLGNVLVNNTLTILLDTLTSGLVAVIGATMGIVIFGEIVPQAICSRHGLAVGAYTIWLTKFFMVLTFPLSYPISKILDKVLGAEIGTVYNKKKLIELLRVTDANNDLEQEEVDIVTGALVYKDKTVRDVMTKLEDVYMLPLQAILDFETVSEIRSEGYSRIPIYDGDRKNIVHILFAKDLMFVDPDDKMPVTMVCEFYSNDVNFVFHDTPLNVMFNEFKSGDKGHMAFVQEINTLGEGDPFYETIGLVTLEDIIEEIIQQEIVDETDVVIDNRTKRRRKKEQGVETNFHKWNLEERNRVTISPQLALAVFQYLTTSIEPFKGHLINDSVLKKLLALDIFREIKIKKDKSKMSEEDLIIIQKGKPIDFFILIIEGRVEANVGPENLIFESGPFTYYGIQALLNAKSDFEPSSPVISHHLNRATTSPLAIAADGVMNVVGRASLRKAHTQHPLEHAPSQPVMGTSGKRNSVAATSHTSDGGHKGLGHMSNFIPDYTVKAASDVLYLKIRRSTYLAAIKASNMVNKTSQHGGLNEKDIDLYLERVTGEEDQTRDSARNLVMRSPSTRSASNVVDQERSESPSMKDALLKTAAALVGLGTPDEEKANDESTTSLKRKGSTSSSEEMHEMKINNGPSSIPATIVEKPCETTENKEMVKQQSRSSVKDTPTIAEEEAALTPDSQKES